MKFRSEASYGRLDSSKVRLDSFAMFSTKMTENATPDDLLLQIDMSLHETEQLPPNSQHHQPSNTSTEMDVLYELSVHSLPAKCQHMQVRISAHEQYFDR